MKLIVLELAIIAVVGFSMCRFADKIEASVSAKVMRDTVPCLSTNLER